MLHSSSGKNVDSCGIVCSIKNCIAPDSTSFSPWGELIRWGNTITTTLDTPMLRPEEYGLMSAFLTATCLAGCSAQFRSWQHRSSSTRKVNPPLQLNYLHPTFHITWAISLAVFTVSTAFSNSPSGNLASKSSSHCTNTSVPIPCIPACSGTRGERMWGSISG